MAKNIKKKTQTKPVYMTISEANAHNAMTPNNAFMIGIGTEDSPEFLYPEGLKHAIVTSSKKESDYKQAEKEASTFRNRSLAGHIGTGLGLDLGDKSLQNIAATAIGVPLVATNPVTTTLMKPLIKGIGHAGKVLLDPTKALTGVGQTVATTADIYGTIEGLRQIPGAINNIKQGNGTAMDYFNLATGLMGPFGTFNVIKGARFNPYLRQVAGYKNLGLDDGDRLSHIEQTTNGIRTPADDPVVQRMFEAQQIRTQQMINQAQRAEDDLLDWVTQGNEPEITPFRPNINFGNNGTQNSIRQSTNNSDVIDELASRIHIDSQNTVPTNIQNEIDEIFQTANRNHPYSSYFARKEFMTELRNKGLITKYLQKEIGKSINDIVGNYFYDGKKFIDKSEVINELKALGHSDDSINNILTNETDNLVRFIQGSSRNFDFPTLRITKPSFNEATHAKRIELAHLEDSGVIEHLFEDNGALRQGLGKGIYTKKDYNFTNEDIELLEQLVNNYNKSTNNNISVTDVLNDADNMADLRNYLRNHYSYFGVKGKDFPGDINHMSWFQAGHSSGYNPTNNYKKVTNQVNRDVSDLIASIPRGYALGETNTSFDSEMLKLLHTLKNKNYRRGKGQISIEFNKNNHGIVIDAGNSAHKERIFVKDLYDKYKYKLSETDKEVLEEIINRGRRSKIDETKELAKNISPELESIIKSEYDNLGKTLSTKMQNVWDRLIQKDPTLKDAPKISSSEFNKYRLLEFISEGNITPQINRPSIRIQKNKYGGDNKFKFGGMKQNKVFKLNGGMAVPLDDKKRLFYLSGAKHEQGGIDVTPELEAEGGEVIKVNPKSIKVVTAQKIMGGKSPAELVVDASSTGEQDKVFNKVFKYQEDFKDRNNLNDDGTKKARFGKKVLDRLNKFYWHTLRAPKDYSDEKAVLRNGCTTKECAKWSNDQLQKAGLNIFGHAWTRNDNKGIKKIYSGYDVSKRPKTYDEKAVIDYTLAAADSLAKTLDVSKLQQNDIVGLYYRHSPNVETAYKNGTNGETQTHTGHVVVEDGVPYVVHNVNENIIKNKVEDIIGSKHPYGITSIYRKQLGGEMKNKKKALVGTQQPFIFTPLLERNKPTLTRTKSPFDRTNAMGITTDLLTGKTYYPDAFNYNNSPYSTYNVKTGKTSYNNLLGDTKLNYKKQSTSDKNKNGTERTPLFSTEDLIIGGINLGGSLIDLAVKHSLPVKSVKYNDPIPFTAIKNKTKININPELQELENTINEYKDSINQNTSSSQVALSRLRNINLEKLNRINKLYGYKENKETELINENNRNLQNIINANIQQKNAIDQKNLENEIQTMNLNRLQRTDDITDFVQNIAGTAGNIISNIEQREQFDKNLAAMIMGYENIDAEEKYKLIQELTKKNKRIKRSKKE